MKKFIIVFIFIVVLFFVSIYYVVFCNNKYENNMIEDIKNNYSLEEDIKYLNKSDFHYIIKTNTLLILLDDSYSLVQEVELDKLYEFDVSYDIVYRLNNLMYEIKEISNSKVIYKYYDIYNGNLIEEISV